jgi:hypothetical protein
MLCSNLVVGGMFQKYGLCATPSSFLWLVTIVIIAETIYLLSGEQITHLVFLMSSLIWNSVIEIGEFCLDLGTHHTNR